MAHNIIFWEWSSDGICWSPYIPSVSNYIENAFMARQSSPVYIGYVCAELRHISVDVINNLATDSSRGNQCLVRRNNYRGTSLAAESVIWQWLGDDGINWCCYSFEVGEMLEIALRRGDSILDLEQTPVNLPYIIELRSIQMAQVRKITDYRRPVRRFVDVDKYSVDRELPILGPSHSVAQPPWSASSNLGQNSGWCGPSASHTLSEASSRLSSVDVTPSMDFLRTNQSAYQFHAAGGCQSVPPKKHVPKQKTRNARQLKSNKSTFTEWRQPSRASNESSDDEDERRGKRRKVPLNVGDDNTLDDRMETQHTEEASSADLASKESSTWWEKVCSTFMQPVNTCVETLMEYIRPIRDQIENLSEMFERVNLKRKRDERNGPVNRFGPASGNDGMGSQPRDHQSFDQSVETSPTTSSVPKVTVCRIRRRTTHTNDKTSAIPDVSHHSSLPVPGYSGIESFSNNENVPFSRSSRTADVGLNADPYGSASKTPHIHHRQIDNPTSWAITNDIASAAVRSNEPKNVVGGGVLINGFWPSYPSSSSASSYDDRNSTSRGPVDGACVTVQQEDESSDANAASILNTYGEDVVKPPMTEDCCICCQSLADVSGFGDDDDDGKVVKLRNCDHMFHFACLCQMFNSGPKTGSLICPSCKHIYGTKMGGCPNGLMTYCGLPQDLDGYPGCGSIRITYDIRSGRQNGVDYRARGFPRHGYLPNNDKGNQVLELLKEAWRRRLTFTIGTSVTTNEPNVVVWNEIHHKTSPTNERGHGYPDPNYLDNVIGELAAQGVTDVRTLQ